MRLSFALIALLPACVLSVHRGDGVSTTETRDVGDFDGVSAENGLDVVINLGDVTSVAVTCDSNLLPDIQTVVRGGMLEIKTEDGLGGNVVIAPNSDCWVELVVPDLRELVATGSGDIVCNGDAGVSLERITATGSGDIRVDGMILTGTLDATTTGSGTVSVEQLFADAADITSTGSGGLEIRGGEAGGVDISVTGSGDVHASDLVASDVSAHLTGSGDGAVWATERIEGSLTGSGDLIVYGSPAQRDVQTTGSGDVTWRD